jgi:hypothetical protein
MIKPNYKLRELTDFLRFHFHEIKTAKFRSNETFSTYIFEKYRITLFSLPKGSFIIIISFYQYGMFVSDTRSYLPTSIRASTEYLKDYLKFLFMDDKLFRSTMLGSSGILSEINEL